MFVIVCGMGSNGSVYIDTSYSAYIMMMSIIIFYSMDIFI